MIWLLETGLVCAGLLIVALLWSVVVPERRLWPPKEANGFVMAVVWALAIAVFGAAIVLGVLDWNSFGWPALARWIVGLALIAASNVAVWSGVAEIGVRATSGAEAELQTGGLYRYSRNPQYVADIVMLVGWTILSASWWALPVSLAGIAALALAPFAEESWLSDVYGEKFDQYRKEVRRYL